MNPWNLHDPRGVAMRILMLTSSYPKYAGETTAPFIEEIAAGLAARGHIVHLVAPWHPELRRAPNERGVFLHFYRYAPHPTLNVWGYAQALIGDRALKWQTIGVTPFALLGAIQGMWQAIHAQASPFDLLHAHWVIPNAPPAMLVAWATRRPLIISLHGNDIYLAERYAAVAAAAGFSLRHAAAVTACSTDLLRRGVRLGAHPCKSVFLPYGVNAEEFRPDSAARDAVRATLSLAADEPIVLGLGRLVHKKGFDVLLDAWPLVQARHPRALLVLAGYGDLQSQLVQRATALGIRVAFPGQLERKHTAAYLAAADVFALPLVSGQGTDGLPNTLLEAMGAGRPVVASRVAGVPDVVMDGQNGLLVPERDPVALATAIIQLLDDPAWANRLGTAARAHVISTLTWDHTAQRLEQLYARVSGRGDRIGSAPLPLAHGSLRCHDSRDG